MQMSPTRQVKFSKLRNRGVALIVAVVFLITIVTVVVLTTSSALVRDVQIANIMQNSTQSYYLAESGLEDAYYRLTHSISVPSSYTIPLGSVNASVTVADNGINQKQISSSAAINSHTRSLQLILNTAVSGSVFGYAVQAGADGMTLSNNASVGITSGDVYSNGPITGATNASVAGNVTVAGVTTMDATAKSTVCTANQDLGKTGDLAQSFVPSTSDALSSVSVWIEKVSSPSSTLTLYIVPDNAGSPGTTALATGTLITSVGSSYTWGNFTFATPPLLTAGTTYWIVIDASSTNGSKYWNWCRDGGGGYSGGVAKKGTWSGGPWSSVTGDLNFELYLGAGQSTLSTMRVNGSARAHTISGSTIIGDAYYQSISGSTVGGTSHSSWPDSSTLAFPFSDATLATWRSVAASGGTISGNCPGATGCATKMGPVKVSGNLTVSGNFVLSGIVYVTGNVTFSNNANVSCDPAFGSDSCIFITDGYISIGTGVTISGSGTTGSYMLLISTIPGCLGSTTSGCTPTGNAGIYINTSTTGGVFYANKSLITLNNGSGSPSPSGIKPTEIVGYKVNLGNYAAVQYPSNLTSAEFSTAPGGVWSVASWKEN